MLVTVMVAVHAGWAQDPAFSQFYANPLFMNPAMAGVEGPAKVYVGYRNQWPGATDPYSTYHASYEQYITSLQGGVGVHVINDRQGAGIFNSISLDAIYSYHLRVSSDLMVTGGFQASVGQRNMNPDGLVVRKSSLRGAVIDSRSDHRMVMTMAVAALAAKGRTRISHIDCIKKTFPDFVGQMRAVGCDMQAT